MPTIYQNYALALKVSLISYIITFSSIHSFIYSFIYIFCAKDNGCVHSENENWNYQTNY